MIDEDDLTCDAITRDFRIFQRRRGHRYSLDDVATASGAVQAKPGANTYVDLGCGIGSVLLMVTWRLSNARAWGIEALDESIELARRSVRSNGLHERVSLRHGDLRDVARTWAGPRVDLVTGTPPYLPRGTALASPDAQRAAARIELRGGVEDYLVAASRLLAGGGRVVVCSDARHPERVPRGAEQAALLPLQRHDILPRAGASPLFSVWTLRALGPDDDACQRWTHTSATMRDAEGKRTTDALAMRARFGL
ncbi:MAG TPA: methyltransferase domain-containing protein [Polyangiaceae bacterium]|nr:methyltransferase domain-containing protein [Polyangiaceae bacterium]